MTDFLDTQFGIHGRALQLRAQRLDVIASNIANAATPGFKARDIDVDATLAGGSAFGAALDNALKYRVPSQVSLDGNTVELATEQAAFAQNAVQYRASLGFLTSRIQSLMAALKGGE
ncbi:flagellar basal body rod protein FlgB [Sandarakinorhabdus sp.]|uniref:flagellar basal body rod protein FlgB n=1 Tax=Sandarakinorhabdus sp. TaxID=1916663 RepID=UPI00286E27DC|nr:flagellar basal body rod protein FlgB [Sandarakinorhabdus sp.]